MADTDKTKAYFEADFLPRHSPTAMPPTEYRVAGALEYIAYHMGQIDKKLDKIVSALEKAR